MRDSAETLSPTPSAAVLTAAGDRARGAERWRRILVSTGSSVGARVGALLCNLATIPLALQYLGTAQFGVWMTLTSAVNLLSCLDCGVGVGLQNRMAALMGRDALRDAAYCIRSTVLVLLLIAGAAAAVLGVLIFATDLPVVLLARTGFAPDVLRAVVAIVAGAFVLSLPLSLFTRAAIGLQQGWMANVAATSGTLLTLAGVCVAAWLELGFATFIAVSVVPLFATQLVCCVLVARRLPGGLPLLGTASLAEGLRTLREGSRFVLPQVGGLVLTQSPLLLLGTTASPVSAAVYAVFTRISVPLQQLQQMFLAQVWPAITEALHRGDREWLQAALRRVLRLNVAYSLVLLVGTAAGIQLLFPLLTRSADLSPSRTVVLLYVAHVAVLSVVQGIAYVTNGLSRVRHQNTFAVVSILVAFTALPFCAARFDIAGLLAALLALNLLVGLPLLWRDYASYRTALPRPEPVPAHVG